jgi:DNA-binding MarR family transcriptional regulator
MAEVQPETLADQVFHRLLSLQHTSRRHTRQLIDERGLSPRDFSVLRYLLEAGSATVGQVQAYLHKSLSTTSALIAQMEAKDYVSRTRSREDNRVVIVTLTAKGHEIAENTPMRGLPLLRRRLRSLSPPRLSEMLGVLNELMQLMEATNPE